MTFSNTRMLSCQSCLSFSEEVSSCFKSTKPDNWCMKWWKWTLLETDILTKCEVVWGVFWLHLVTWVCLKVKDRKSTEMVDSRRQPTGVRAKSETFESQPCQLLYASLPCINSLGPVPCSDGKAGYCLGTNHYTSTYTKTIQKKIIYTY